MLIATAAETFGISKSLDMENIQQKVCDTFDELLAEISSTTKFHPSEIINEDKSTVKSEPQTYTLINRYHAFCKLCDKHFYSSFVASDINSFFQKHINTSYHRLLRTGNFLPKDSPMFTWEKEWYSGKCNLCEMSNLNTYFINGFFDLKKVIKDHNCFWDQENRNQNEKVVLKLNLIKKKYCGLNLFREKCIKIVNGGGFCLLCSESLPWLGEKAYCHLYSDIHYEKFCMFVQNYFNLTPQDMLNGFNLEMITRWFASHDFPFIMPVTLKTTYQDERTRCFWESNRNENLYVGQKYNLNFSQKRYTPKEFENTKEFLLCKMDESQKNGKAMETNCGVPCIHPEKLMRTVKNDKNLLLKQDDSSVEIPKKKLTYSQKYLNEITKEKLSLVREIFTGISKNKCFCEVCCKYVCTTQKNSHLGSSEHKINLEKWKSLKAMISEENNRVLEPFQKIKNKIACLICCCMLNRDSFFSHLQGGTHEKCFESYSKVDVEISISSAFFFGEYFCRCRFCKWKIYFHQNQLEALLLKILEHWPCSKMREKKKKEVERKVNVKTTGESSIPNESLPIIPVFEPGHFEKLEVAVIRLMDVFESEILKKVIIRSNCVIGRSDSSGLVKSKQKLERMFEIQKQSDQGSTSRPLAKRKGQKNGKTNLKNKENGQGKEEQKGVRKTKEDKKYKEEEEHEVLLISDCPGYKKKEKRKFIRENFSSFGKICYIVFEENVSVLAFTESGIAQSIAEKSPLKIKNFNLTLVASTRKLQNKTTPDLNEAIVSLLRDPPALMEFVLQLEMKALTKMECPIELKQEKDVCLTIINALSVHYPMGRCFPFGSRLSGLTLNYSDLDVFFDCGGMYSGFKNTSSQAEKKIVSKIGSLLRVREDITHVTVVVRARVPIVSFLHKPTLIRCDLSFKNGLSVQNTKLIKFLLTVDQRVRSLILFLKYWAKLNELHGRPNFSSYAIGMMVIFYLQQLECPVLPSIESLQIAYEGPRKTIAGWDCSISTSVLTKSKNKEPFTHLLMGFFKFYADFDYDENIIFPLSGQVLNKKMFSESGVRNLPMCYKRHILNISSPLQNLVANRINIIDPFDVSFVLTKNIPSKSLDTFIHLCRASAEELEKAFAACEAKR